MVIVFNKLCNSDANIFYGVMSEFDIHISDFSAMSCFHFIVKCLMREI